MKFWKKYCEYFQRLERSPIGQILTALLLLVIFWFLTGCSLICPQPPECKPEIIIQREIVNIPTPVYYKEKLPESLTKLSDVQIPKFISPKDASATSALNSEGEVQLKIILLLLNDLHNAAKEWSRIE